jgi:quinol monooxygenase YgiN
MPVTSIFDIHLPKPSPAVYDVVLQVAAQTRSYAGNTGVQVLADQSDPTHLMVIGAWNSVEEFTAYQSWRAGDGAPETLSALLAVPPSTTLFVPVR